MSTTARASAPSNRAADNRLYRVEYLDLAGQPRCTVANAPSEAFVRQFFARHFPAVTITRIESTEHDQ